MDFCEGFYLYFKDTRTLKIRSSREYYSDDG
jgi:hypothetical protein